jgi:Protein of unknown function (DUF4239)
MMEIIPSEIRIRGIKFIAGAMAIYAILRLIGLHSWLSHDGEGIGVLLQIIGTLYSVVYAFATYVIWGQFAAVENEILRESGSLKELILFSRPLKEAARDPLVRAIRAYARAVTESEWPALSRGEDTERTDKLFGGIISTVIELKPESDGDRPVIERLLAIANQASAHRDERLAISRKRIPRTLLFFVTLTAASILFLLLLYPFANLALALVSIALATLLLFFAHFVLTDLDNPFEGTWNVSNRSFEELTHKYR